jgi:hypothetical protein
MMLDNLNSDTVLVDFCGPLGDKGNWADDTGVNAGLETPKHAKMEQVTNRVGAAHPSCASVFLGRWSTMRVSA